MPAGLKNSNRFQYQFPFFNSFTIYKRIRLYMCVGCLDHTLLNAFQYSIRNQFIYSSYLFIFLLYFSLEFFFGLPFPFMRLVHLAPIQVNRIIEQLNTNKYTRQTEKCTKDVFILPFSSRCICAKNYHFYNIQFKD